MEPWVETTVAIAGLVGTVLGVLGISGYLGERARHRAEKKNKQEDKTEEEAKAAEARRLEDTVRGVFQEENREINDKLDNITAEIEELKSNLAANTAGTVTLLRNDMKKLLDSGRKQEYASTSDKANWHELYTTYKSLGGNHFKEYVNAWKKEFDELPTVPPTSQKKKTAKKVDSEK